MVMKGAGFCSKIVRCVSDAMSQNVEQDFI